MKLSLRISFLFFLLLLGPRAFSQYTDLINTNRPGQSQSAFSVGRNVYQLEFGLGFGKEEHTLLETKTTGLFSEYAIRVGILLEELEFSLTGAYQYHDIKYLDLGYSEKVSNFTSNTLGAKYLIYDPYIQRELDGPNLYSWRKNNRFQLEDLVPAVAVYAGINMDAADNPFIYENDLTFSPRFMIITQNNWVGGWVFVMNFIADRISTEYPSLEYIVSLTRTMRTGTTMLLENHGIYGDFYADQLIRVGVAQLINPDFQIDISLQLNFKDTPNKTYGKIGFSYRLDRHYKDDYLEEKGPFGRNLKKERLEKTKEEKREERKEERKSKKRKSKESE